MTPDRSKRPLPSSTSFVLPEHPTTYQQWKTALQRVKILYLRGQWKHCVARCRQLLVEARSPVSAIYPWFEPSDKPKQLQALHASYLHFYCALSNEATARVAHPLSVSKLQSLEEAKTSYEAAASRLPAPQRFLDLDPTFDDDCDTCSTHSSSSVESEILDYYRYTSRPSTPHDDASSFSTVESVNVFQGSGFLKPSPLRIRKSPLSDNQDNQLFSQALTQAPSAPPPTFRPPTPPRLRPASISLSDTSDWLRRCSLERYNSHLASFASMLANHVSNIESLILKTREAQSMRYFAKRLASYGEDETAKAADLKARAVRLKAAGWRRERFRPEKYQELCDRALEEL